MYVCIFVCACMRACVCELGGCEPLYLGAGNGTQEGPLEEQEAVLTAEPSLQDPASALFS